MKKISLKVINLISITVWKSIVPALAILLQISPIKTYSQKLIPYLKKNGNYIYVDSISFKSAIKQEFTEASEFQPNGNAIVIKNNKWGIINKSGIEVAPCKYDLIENYVSGIARVGYKTNDTSYAYKSINIDGKEYQTIDSSKRYIDERYNFGYVNQNGIEVIPPIYRNLVQLNDSIFHCQVDFKAGLINIKNEFILPAIYKDAFALKNGYIVIVDQSWKKALSNQAGNLITNFKYDEIEDFQNGLAKVVIGDDYNTQKMGWIDLSGKEIIPVNYSVKGTRTFSNEYIFYNEIKSRFGLSTSGEYQNVGYIDKSKGQITKLSFGNYLFINFKNDYFFAENISSSELLIINKSGKVLTKQNNYYTIDYSFSRSMDEDNIHNSMIKIESHKKFVPLTKENIKEYYFSYGMIDIATGKIIIPAIFHNVDNFFDSIAVVSYTTKGSKKHPYWISGAFDINGKLVIPMMYDQISYFNQGSAFVSLHGKCGMIDKNNKIIIPIVYDNIEEFTVNKNESSIPQHSIDIYSLGTKNEKSITESGPTYKHKANFKFNLIKVFLKGKIGFLNTKGSVVIPPKYKFATIQQSGVILAISNNIFNGRKYFYIDRSGREYIER